MQNEKNNALSLHPTISLQIHIESLAALQIFLQIFLHITSTMAIFRLHYFILINFLLPFAHPLSFNITQFDAGRTDMRYEGEATPLSGRIELSAVEPLWWRVGRATYAEPSYLWDSTTGSLANFTTHFTFSVNTGGNNQFSDGFAFFLAPVGYPIPPNSAGGLLGLFNSTNSGVASQNQIVAVEFDTYSNTQWDPTGPHVGINIHTISSVVNASWNFSSHYDKKVANAWITYKAATQNLSVFWTYEKNPVFLDNSSLSYNIDLRKFIPEWVTIGFSAASGLSPEWHTIHSWEFSSDLDSDHISSKIKGKRKNTFLIAGVAVSFVILMLGVALSWLVVVRTWRKRILGVKKNNSNALSSINTDLEKLAFPRRFAYQELVAATNDFARDRRLGQGGSGQVYKGVIQDLGFLVAVKRIFAESEPFQKIFVNEVKIISRLIHRNVVQFVGWSHEQGECLLVYAYMPNSSLDTHLFGCRPSLPWDYRYKAALGLASALHYLHEDAEQCVLHRDIKSANVLLDDDFSAKLGDFGIAKLVDPRFRTQASAMVGTFGYIAPEYACEGSASKESDMYSFGVVALEIACGRKAYQGGGHLPLFRWVWQMYLAGNLLHAADERLNMNFDRDEMECLLLVGLWCTHPDKRERPNAGKVIKYLLLETWLPELPHDMHNHPLPQRQQAANSASYGSLTSSLNGGGR